MRQVVFRHDARKRDAKIADCERALAALGRIEARLAADNVGQPSLFELEGGYDGG